MYPSKDARELAILLQISRELDIVGDVSATVDNPSELLAWDAVLTDATIVAWRSQDSGHRYLQVTAEHRRAPVRGRVAAVLPCEQHPEFWHALDLDQDQARRHPDLSSTALSKAWSMTPPDLDIPSPAPPEPSGQTETSHAETADSRPARQSDE